ncbi:TetR family transcriptional regulator [Nocardia sp. SYP-A9097]|uniref:TetR/AcrR family transcriptional regulator n=1 Tax=Nocardia sp. SYP-A9097 TaxID=2663237 RepID=UPI00132502BD|nr:TetR/AcrR family transcriptional regulator [Nocardia sp. SYP-A9097]MRH91509.1 TetR family transcriptional regulator [Nocardia sp. SYP-A9097]
MSVEGVGVPGPLPRGRHGLSREQVENSQYQRLCVAVLDAVGELGYAATTVADIVSRAQVARRTFYAVFGGKDECFAAAYDLAVGTALDQLQDTVTGLVGVSFAERVRISFDIYLSVLAAQPAAARALYVETLAAGPGLVAHRARVHRRFADYILTVANIGVRDGELAGDPDPELIDMLLGGIDDRVRDCLHERDATQLPSLSPLFTRTAIALVRSSA